MTDSDEEEEDNEEDGGDTIVMDNGSLNTRIGFVTDDKPQIFKTKINDSDNLIYPIKDRICVNYDGIEKLWHYAFYDLLKIEPEEHTIMITEGVVSDRINRENREKYTQILFETFNVPSMYVADQSTLALYATGRTTGLVIDSGYMSTQIVPIYEGYALKHAFQKYKYGGKQCTEQLKKLLLGNTNSNNNNDYINKLDFDDFRVIKEKYGFINYNDEICKKNFCYILRDDVLIKGYLRNIDYNYSNYTSIEIENFCINYYGNLKKYIFSKNKYKLPDGNIIELNNETYKCTEGLFNNVDNNIADLIYEAFNRCDVDIYVDLMCGFVLNGGNTLFNGFQYKLQNELKEKKLVYKGLDPKIIAPKNRLNAVWIGGATLGSLSTFWDAWITKDEYDEYGPGIVHRKCY